MDAEFLKDQLQSMNHVAVVAMQSGMNVGHMEAQAEIKRLRKALQECKNIAEAVERGDDESVPAHYRGLDTKNIYLICDKALAKVTA